MFLKQFVNEGLGNSSYLLGSTRTGEAVVIDPQRDVDVYIEEAKVAALTIKFSLETHLHADFVSGSRELAGATGAAICASAAANLRFPHYPLRERDHVEIGEIVLEVMETPGHSPEHISFLAREEGEEKPQALFSGGALIVGGIARTDLLGHEHAVPLARKAYETLRDKISKLSDDLEVYPTHGGGSYCVAAHSEDRATTIGLERHTNRLFQAASEDDFVKLALEGLPAYPAYFKWMRPVNQKGPRVFGRLPQLVPLLPRQVRAEIEKGALVIDVRRIRDFARGHVPGAYNITLRDAFSTWLGWIVPPEKALVFVDTSSESHETIVRQCIRIGYDDLTGYLKGGMDAWKTAGYPVSASALVTPEELSRKLASGKGIAVLDVREIGEWREGHIPGAVHIPLGELQQRINEVPKTGPVAVTCASGQRSSSAVSLLKREGFEDVENIVGGTIAWEKADLPLQKD